jgi:tetratricopeptide (TPR) repeat protein
VELSERKNALLIIALFIAVAIVVYGSSLFNGFVSWDDPGLILGNAAIRNITPKNLAYIFTHFDPELYIPLTFFSYQLSYAIAGLTPFAFHATDLLLHTINALLVCWLLFHFTQSRSVSILLGLLFLIHPLNTEAVAWASARKDTLSSAFFLGSLVAYVHFMAQKKYSIYSWSLALFFLGLLSKVTVIGLPILLLFIDWWKGRKINVVTLIEKIPFFVLSIIFGIVALFGKVQVSAASTLAEKLIMAGRSTVFYLWKFILPVELSVLYPWNGSILIASPSFFVPMMIVVVFAAVVIWSLKKTRHLFFGAAFFAVPLIPSFLNIAKGGEVYMASDRYAYLPLLGVLLAIGFAAAFWLKSAKNSLEERTRERSLFVASAVILVASGFLSFTQAAVWRDSQTLYDHAMDVSPNAVAAYNNLAVLLRDEGRLDEAMTLLEKADAVRRRASTAVNIGSIKSMRGQYVEAVALYKKALTMDPKDPLAHFGLGIVHGKMGQLDEAIREYRAALAITPDHTASWINLAAVLLELKKTDEAIATFTHAADLDSLSPVAPYNIGIIMEEQSKFSEAEMWYKRALKADPLHIDALAHLSVTLLKEGKYGEALDAIHGTLKLDPDNILARDAFQNMLDRKIIEPVEDPFR